MTSMTMRAAQQWRSATPRDRLARPWQWGAHTPAPPHSRVQFGRGPEVALAAVPHLPLLPLLGLGLGLESRG